MVKLKDGVAANTIRKAFESSDKILAETDGIAMGETNVNVSPILDILIREAGRWTERYASDLFISWRHVDDVVHGRYPRDGIDEVLVFAIRRDGIDENRFLACRMTQNVTKFHPWLDKSMYRKILALRITCGENRRCSLVLKDIENYLLRLDPKDVDEY